MLERLDRPRKKAAKTAGPRLAREGDDVGQNHVLHGSAVAVVEHNVAVGCWNHVEVAQRTEGCGGNAAEAIDHHIRRCPADAEAATRFEVAGGKAFAAYPARDVAGADHYDVFAFDHDRGSPFDEVRSECNLCAAGRAMEEARWAGRKLPTRLERSGNARDRGRGRRLATKLNKALRAAPAAAPRLPSFSLRTVPKFSIRG